MGQAIRKAVFPVAGLGTRFMPATKAVPKEMLPVLDRPLIDYAVSEARAAGIETFVFVTGRKTNEEILRSYFEMTGDLEAALKPKNPELVASLKAAEPPKGSVICVRQDEPHGLGHAVWCAREHVGDEPFAVVLPDDLMDASPPCLGQMMDVYAETGGNVIAVEEVPLADTRKYGVLDVGAVDGPRVEVQGLVEKPAPEDAPSSLTVVGRYLLLPEVFDHLERHERGAGGEIQLTDAMARMIGKAPFHGLRFAGRRYDCGSRAGFIEAQLGFALADPELRCAVRAFMRETVEP